MEKSQIESLIPEEARSEFAMAFLSEYLKDGFGASTKRATELHLFHLLDRFGRLDEHDNVAISRLLQITESRVKSLRYEGKLRFPPDEEKYIERRILWCLARSVFDLESKRIRFIVEDPYVRKELSARSKRIGGVPDTSFNSEIVTLRVDQLVALIKQLYGEPTGKNFEKQFEKLAKADAKVSFAEVRKAVVLGAAKAFGAGVVKGLTAYFTGVPA